MRQAPCKAFPAQGTPSPPPAGALGEGGGRSSSLSAAAPQKGWRLHPRRRRTLLQVPRDSVQQNDRLVLSVAATAVPSVRPQRREGGGTVGGTRAVVACTGGTWASPQVCHPPVHRVALQAGYRRLHICSLEATGLRTRGWAEGPSQPTLAFITLSRRRKRTRDPQIKARVLSRVRGPWVCRPALRAGVRPGVRRWLGRGRAGEGDGPGWPWTCHQTKVRVPGAPKGQSSRHRSL